MTPAIFALNHDMSARSSGESACVTRAVGPRQSSGNSAVARLKKEYDSVKPGSERPPASGAGDESAAEARGGGHRAPRRRRAEARREAEGTRRTRGGDAG